MPPAPPTPAERLTELSSLLSRGAEACDNGWWLAAPLMAMIATWLRDMAESLAHLAALLQAGKLLLQPAAPNQGTSRPAGKPSAPLPKPEKPERPAATPGRARRTLRPLAGAPEGERPAAQPPPEPPNAEPAAERLAPPRPPPSNVLPGQPAPPPVGSARGPPFSARADHTPNRVNFITITKRCVR